MKGYKLILPRQNYQIIASVKKRGLAFLIDLLIFFFFIMTPFLFMYYNYAGIPIENVSMEFLLENDKMYSIAVIGDFSSYAIFFFYLVSSELLLNATIGKKIMNLRVVSKASNRKPRMLQLIIRNLSKSFLISILPFDAILMFFDPEHRRLLDYLSKTLVVEDKKRIKKFPVVNEV